MPLKLFKTTRGPMVDIDGTCTLLPDVNWDTILNRDDLGAWLREAAARGERQPAGFDVTGAGLLPPIGTQEVWAAGVTYFRSRDARMEESKKAGGGSFYDRVYSADRPELFMKATPHRVSGSGQMVRIRADAKWNVPEPELTLVINSGGRIIGHTIGNDMSSRDIEGENPLYLPQAKVYLECCGLGPGILVTDEPLPVSTPIRLCIERPATGGSTDASRHDVAFEGSTTLEQLKRKPAELVAWLFRDNAFPAGAFLLTGTGIIPPDTFTLQSGDRVSITIDPIGTLVNGVR